MKIDLVKAVVTGAGSGMGRSFARMLAANGAKVVAADIDPKGLSETAKGMPGLHTHVGDAADEAAIKEMFQAAREAMGGCNVLINNAGIIRDGLLIKKDKEGTGLENMSTQHWNDVIRVNLSGPFLCTRAFAAQCVTHEPEGVIVNISSCSRHGNPGQSNYSAAKAGLVADTKCWGEELARHNIRVGAIAPGFVRTPILEAMRPEVLEKIINAGPLKRMAEPEDIYMGVKFIIECNFFTGRCIDIDGGFRA